MTEEALIDRYEQEHEEIWRDVRLTEFDAVREALTKSREVWAETQARIAILKASR